MKRFLSAMLGLGLVLGSASLFAQDTTTEKPKKVKKAKKMKKMKKTTEAK